MRRVGVLGGVLGKRKRISVRWRWIIVDVVCSPSASAPRGTGARRALLRLPAVCGMLRGQAHFQKGLSMRRFAAQHAKAATHGAIAAPSSARELSSGCSSAKGHEALQEGSDRLQILLAKWRVLRKRLAAPRIYMIGSRPHHARCPHLHPPPPPHLRLRLHRRRRRRPLPPLRLPLLLRPRCLRRHSSSPAASSPSSSPASSFSASMSSSSSGSVITA